LVENSKFDIGLTTINDQIMINKKKIESEHTQKIAEKQLIPATYSGIVGI